MKLQTVMLCIGGADELTAARDWYRDKLGLPLTWEEGRESVWFDTEGFQLGLHVGTKVDPPGNVQLYFSVPDAHVSYEELTERGVRFVGPPERQAWGAITALTADPAGHAVFVTQFD